MADKSIGTLPMIETLADDASFVAEQQGSAGRVTGAQFKSFAKEGVEQYVTAAQEAAQKSMEASEKALEAVESVEGAADEAAAAQAAAEAAEAAKEAAEAAQVAAEAARDQAQAIAGGDFLSIAGGTLTGPLVLPGSPTEDNQAATKKYVDDAVGSGTLLTKADYDPSGEVASAGGIPAYVASNSQAEPELYMTTITYANSAYSTNHTYAEIFEAYNAGKICMAMYGGTQFMLRYISETYILFSNPPSDTGLAYAIKITSEDAITYSTATYLMKSSLSSSVTSTSTTTPANSAAVKAAYDKAVSAEKNAVSLETGTYTVAIPSDYAAFSLSSTTQGYVKIGGMLFLSLKTTLSSTNTAIRQVPIVCTGFPSGSFSARHPYIFQNIASSKDYSCVINIDSGNADNMYIVITHLDTSELQTLIIDTVIPIIIS